MNNHAIRQTLITLVPSLLVLAMLAAAAAIFDANIPKLTKDVAATAGVHPLTGLLSSLGVLLWAATAAICAFVASAVGLSGRRNGFWFLSSASLLTAYLLFDDFFLFHEKLAPDYLGVREEAVFVFMGLAVAGFLLGFRRVIVRTRYPLLGLALFFLGLSVVVDALLGEWLVELEDWLFLMEDGFKWLGISTWCSYFVETSYRFLLQTFKPRTVATASAV